MTTREMPKILNPKEVAEVLKVTTETLFRWRQKGDGPDFIKTGRYIKYSHGDILRWINQNKVHQEHIYERV